MNGMDRLGQWIADNPTIIMAAALLLTVVSLHYAQQIEMQGMTTESMVGKDSPLYQLYDHLYVENFGTESIAVLVEADDVTKPEVLKAMLDLSDKMKEAPDVLGVTSIADIVAGAEESKTGVRSIPTQASIDEILSDSGNPAINAIMPDKKHTMLSIELPVSLTEAQLGELYLETGGQVKMADFPGDVGVTVTGQPALMKSITEEMAKSNGPILALAGLLMIVALLLTFNHVKWSLLPIPVVFLGVTWTFGAMGLLHIPFTMVSMSAFPVLIGIGIDYAIQFHNRIDEEFSKGVSPVKAVIETVKHVSMPVMIALIITAMGFVSLLTSSVPMTRYFGLICLIGLFLCYLSALFVGVTLLYIVERRGTVRRSNNAGDAAVIVPKDTVIGSILERISDICIQKWHMVLAIALLLSLFGVYADTKVLVDTDFKNYVPQDLGPLIEFRHMSDVFGGTDTVELLVQADDITDPAILKWMDEFCIYLKNSRDQIFGYTSLAIFVKQANGGEMPQDQTTIHSLIDGLPTAVRDRYLDGHNTAIIDLNVGKAITNLGAEGTDRLIKEIDRDVAWHPPPPGVSVRETGDSVVMTTVISALTTGRTEMTLLGLVLIFIVLLLIYRDLIKALLPVLPMLVVIGWMGGVMYVFGMKYTPLTACLGALILGVGSEYAILMMERFYEELAKIGEPLEALKIATRRIGSALIASGLTTVFGFAALISSPFLITNNFGTVTVLAIVFALLTTFTVFVVLMYRMEIRREVVENAKYEMLKALRLMKPRRRMIMRLRIAFIAFCLFALIADVQAQNTYIPFELGGDNYYTMYGGPNISASVAGTDEFQRGDTVSLYVDLTNYGRTLGFNEDQTPQNPKEFALANSELQEEYKKTTALGIMASLKSNNPEVDVKSGDQVVQSLKPGDKTQSPLKFTIKIGEHAPAGIYSLGLNLSYDYQDNVRVYASDLSTSGGSPALVNYRVSYIYHKGNQTIPIIISVKKQADFVITNATASLSAGDKKMPVEATYKNIGDDPISDAVARLSIFKPFSSTDDQAYIGALGPGEEKTVVFRIDVDSDATPKGYGINSEIKYTDINGDTVISESMKIPVSVKAASASLLLPAIVILIIIVAAGGYMYRRKQKRA